MMEKISTQDNERKTSSYQNETEGLYCLDSNQEETTTSNKNCALVAGESRSSLSDESDLIEVELETNISGIQHTSFELEQRAKPSPIVDSSSNEYNNSKSSISTISIKSFFFNYKMGIPKYIKNLTFKKKKGKSMMEKIPTQDTERKTSSYQNETEGLYCSDSSAYDDEKVYNIQTNSTLTDSTFTEMLDKRTKYYPDRTGDHHNKSGYLDESITKETSLNLDDDRNDINILGQEYNVSQKDMNIKDKELFNLNNNEKHIRAQQKLKNVVSDELRNAKLHCYLHGARLAYENKLDEGDISQDIGYFKIPPPLPGRVSVSNSWNNK